MKLKNKVLLPILGIAGISLPSIGTLASCSNSLKTIASLSWDASSGKAFVYDESITQMESDSPLTWRDATKAYFEAVGKNYNIFTNDIVNMVYNNYKYWLLTAERTERTPEGKVVSYYGEDQYKISYDLKSVSVKLYQWDVETHRVSFDIVANYKSNHDDWDASAKCEWSVRNHPFSLWKSRDMILQLAWNENPDVECWQFVPEGTSKFWNNESREEIVDPLYNEGLGSNLLLMDGIDGDWSIDSKETYSLPDFTEPLVYSVHYCPGFLKAFTTEMMDDPEVFSRLKFFQITFNLCFINYMDKVDMVQPEP